MTNFQIAIKYLAIVLAILLALAIIVGIVGVFDMIFGIGRDDHVLEESVDIEISQNITALDLQINAAYLKIVEGEQFALSSNIKDLRVSERNGELVITEKRKKVSLRSTEIGEIILVVPEGTVFDRVSIEAGAGDVEVSTLVTGRLDLEFGAGRVDISCLEAKIYAAIETGAGKLTVRGGKINNLDLDLGVGKTELRAAITGNSDIDCGVGTTDIVFCGSRDDYSVRINTGIGSVNVDGSHLSGSTSFGQGSSLISIDGGVGSINIEFENE